MNADQQSAIDYISVPAGGADDEIISKAKGQTGTRGSGIICTGETVLGKPQKTTGCGVSVNASERTTASP